jgi:glycopeptide antibiotics resistance protein
MDIDGMKKYIIMDLRETLQFLPYGLLAGLLLVVLLILVNRFREKKGKKPIHVFSYAAVVTSMGIILCITFFSREPGSRKGIDLELFSTWGINVRNDAFVVENVLLFIPYGFLCAWAFPAVREMAVGGFLLLCTSTGIEFLQLLTQRGYFQIDDIWTNVAGGFVGLLLFSCCITFYRMCHKIIRAITP